MNEILKYNEVKVHPVANGWKTTNPITYKDIQIPKGYYTNGANIPKLLWTLIPPNDPMVFPAVVIHDYLCDKKEYIKADNYMDDILKASAVWKWKRITIVGGIRFYTRWFRKNRGRKQF